MVRAEIVERAIDPGSLLREVAGAGVGASVLFLGSVRDFNAGEAVAGIDYSAYRSMAERELLAIAAEATERFPGTDVIVEHRIGTLGIGDVSVGVATGHAHRAAAYAASRYVIEELKRRVPIWKREHYVDGRREWVGATEPDEREIVAPGRREGGAPIAAGQAP